MSSPSPSPVIVQQPSGAGRAFGCLGWVLFVFTGLALFVVTLMLAGAMVVISGDGESEAITEKHVSGDKTKTDKVAIITIAGVIMEGDGFVKHQIDRIRKDDTVKAIVVRVDSPGGTITGSDYIYHHLNQLRDEKGIKLVVSMGSIAASGGYYVSMAVGDQEKSIYAEPTTTTGSIGVIIPHYNVAGLMEQYKVEDDSVMSHPRKHMLAMTKKMDEEERAIVQGYIMEAFDRFKDIIKTGRPAYRANPEKLDALATGEIFSASKAKENGLVDEIGFLEDAIDQAIALNGLTKSEVQVVKYKRPAALFDLGNIGSAQAKQSELGLLFELSTPKAYYLSSTLPAIFSTHRAD